MTDISSITPRSRKLDVRHPATKQKIGLQLDLRPDTDPAVRDVVRKQTNERLQGERPDAERLEANRLDMIVAAVSGWDWQGDANFEGKKPSFSEPSVRQVLTRLPWIRDQIDIALGDSAAFFRSADEAAG